MEIVNSQDPRQLLIKDGMSPALFVGLSSYKAGKGLRGCRLLFFTGF